MENGALAKFFPQHHILLNLPTALTVTVCGGGHGAHTAAAYLGSKPGLRVNVLTRQPEKWQRHLVIGTANTSWAGKGEIHGLLSTVSSDPAVVVSEADIVLILSPAHTHPPILEKIAPHLKKGALLGSLYCQGGFDWPVRKFLGAAGTLSKIDGFFGLQNIPWITNAPEYGKRIRLIGPKKVLKLAASPPENAHRYGLVVSSLFDIPCEVIPNFLSLALTPSNQIIHPARYYAIFRDWDGEKTYKQNEIQWGLYTEFDQLSADKLALLDGELQAIKKGLTKRYPTLDLTAVMPIAERIVDQYGCDVKDRSSLRQIFNTNLGYAGCVTPTEKVGDDAYLPKVNSRLFWEDIPYGLCILKSLAHMLQIDVPEIDFMIRWHQQFMGVKYLNDDGTLDKQIIEKTGCPEAYGLYNLDDIVKMSL